MGRWGFLFLLFASINLDLFGSVRASEHDELNDLSERIKALVQDYHTQKRQELPNNPPLDPDVELSVPDLVRPLDLNAKSRRSQNHCASVVCNQLPTFECKSQRDWQEIAQLCQRQLDGNCINIACGLLPSFACNSKARLSNIANACQGIEGACLEIVCKHLPGYECQSLADIRDVTQSCGGLRDSRCIDEVCAKLPRYSCADKRDLKKVINACKGR
jgi:hypothetical protein